MCRRRALRGQRLSPVPRREVGDRGRAARSPKSQPATANTTTRGPPTHRGLIMSRTRSLSAAFQEYHGPPAGYARDRKGRVIRWRPATRETTEFEQVALVHLDALY